MSFVNDLNKMNIRHSVNKGEHKSFKEFDFFFKFSVQSFGILFLGLIKTFCSDIEV